MSTIQAVEEETTDEDPTEEETEPAEPDHEDRSDAGSQSLRSVLSHETNHWKGITLAALLPGVLGVLASQPTLLLTSVVGIGYVAYVRATQPPEVSLAVERTFDEPDPAPGEEVTVTVTVRNDGDRLLPDLRVVDGVPDALPVVEGTPRLGTALRPGAVVTVEYTVRAKRGEHVFDELLAVARDLSGNAEREAHVGTDDAIVCTPSVEPTREVPLRALTSRYTGRVETDEGGEGVEFYATREYRSGDSLSRIDWNRHARTGELSTVEFRQERSATAVLVLDLREEAYLRGTEEGIHAADRGVEAASQVFSALLESGDRVGVSAFAPETVWLAPGSGNDHWARARELFSTHPTLSPTVPEARTSVTLTVRRLRQRLPSEAQVVLFSPLCDDSIVRAARLLDAHGHLVTVVSPDPTASETTGQKLAGAERAARMADLRAGGVRVIDWDPEERLATAIGRASRRWSA